jgi:hypothetical protein
MFNSKIITVFRLLTDFVCLYNYDFWLSLCKIVRSSVILLLPLFQVKQILRNVSIILSTRNKLCLQSDSNPFLLDISGGNIQCVHLVFEYRLLKQLIIFINMKLLGYSLFSWNTIYWQLKWGRTVNVKNDIENSY